MKLFMVIIAIFLLNIVFGYWRSNTNKFSLQWFLAIHIPVPIAIGLRLLFLGWNWMMIPVFVITFFVGQYAGGIIRRLLSKSHSIPLSSNLIRDIARSVHRQTKKVDATKLEDD